MYQLAKLGFSQSYTYFAWRNTKEELTDYLTELTATEVRDYFRPNFWPNTPDILTEALQFGGRSAFAARLVLAATLGASYGIYGPAFELQEHRAREPGSEEYLDSEKYERRQWALDRKDNLKDLIARVNRIRRENPALHRNESLAFHPVDNEQLIAYSKTTEDLANQVLVVVNLDPHHAHSGWLTLPLDRFGLDAHQSYQVHDLLTGARFVWQGTRNYVALDPAGVPAHIFQVRRRLRTERDFDYYL
jgi:starch synthase (maltosyl-transferring)